MFSFVTVCKFLWAVCTSYPMDTGAAPPSVLLANYDHTFVCIVGKRYFTFSMPTSVVLRHCNGFTF